MSTPTFAVVVNNPTDQIVVTTTDVAETDSWFNVVYPLQVRWKSEDTSLFITGTGEPTVTPSKGSRGELNISSIVIITIVCVLTVISGVISTIWWARRKKLKQQTALEIVGTGTVVDTQQEFPPELHGQGV